MLIVLSWPKDWNNGIWNFNKKLIHKSNTIGFVLWEMRTKYRVLWMIRPGRLKIRDHLLRDGDIFVYLPSQPVFLSRPSNEELKSYRLFQFRLLGPRILRRLIKFIKIDLRFQLESVYRHYNPRQYGRLEPALRSKTIYLFGLLGALGSSAGVTGYPECISFCLINTSSFSSSFILGALKVACLTAIKDFFISPPSFLYTARRL